MDLDKAHSEGQCFRCGEKGHLVHNCPKPHQQNVRSVDTESNNRGAQSMTTSTQQMFSSLNNEQRAALARELGFVLTPQ